MERIPIALSVIDSDRFLDMPLSTQALYFHLTIRANDIGFVSNVSQIRKLARATDDDLRLLILKDYIVPLGDGVVGIRHWDKHREE